MRNSRSADLPQIVVCGGPRLLPELLTHVLATGIYVSDVTRFAPQDEPGAVDLDRGDWLIRFLGTEQELEPALADLTRQSAESNLMLLSTDGHALIHRADRSEMRRTNVSLNEILEILNMRQDVRLRHCAHSTVQPEEEEWKH